MKLGRSLPELAQELTRQANSKHDFIMPAEEMCVHSFNSNDDMATVLHASPRIRFSDLAHNQVAEYLGIPQSYYEELRTQINSARVPCVDAAMLAHRQQVFIEEAAEYGWSVCPDDDREVAASVLHDNSEPLFDVTLNTLFKSKGSDRRLVRSLDGKARAILSDSYNPDFDNLEVYMMAAKAIEEAGLGHDNVESCECTDKKLYLKVLSPKLQATVMPENLRTAHGHLKEPQVIQAGFVLSNSEVGLGSLSVKLLVFRLACTNGWILEDVFKKRHIGKALDVTEDGTVFSSDTRKADAAARLLKLRDSIKATLDEARFLALVGKIQQTTAIKLEGGIEKVLDKVGQRLALTIPERTEVFSNLIEGADLSAWGLSNAITATAQNVHSYDRATDLEILGGRLLTMEPRELKELVTV